MIGWIWLLLYGIMMASVDVIIPIMALCARRCRWYNQYHINQYFCIIKPAFFFFSFLTAFNSFRISDGPDPIHSKNSRVRINPEKGHAGTESGSGRHIWFVFRVSPSRNGSGTFRHSGTFSWTFLVGRSSFGKVWNEIPLNWVQLTFHFKDAHRQLSTKKTSTHHDEEQNEGDNGKDDDDACYVSSDEGNGLCCSI